jgi:hypothetical protein
VGGRKSANSRFFPSRSALSLFLALFFLCAFALLFCLRAREREGAHFCKSAPLRMISEHYKSKLMCLSNKFWMSDTRYRIKLHSNIRYNVGLCSLSPISEVPISEVPISGSVRYIADHGYWTKCPSMRYIQWLASIIKKGQPCLLQYVFKM